MLVLPAILLAPLALAGACALPGSALPLHVGSFMQLAHAQQAAAPLQPLLFGI